MDSASTGELIRRLRKERGLTQRELAESICVGAKAVSKWETGAGCPDVSLLPALSRELGVGIDALLAGSLPENAEENGNMKKLSFYVCPDCGNIITSSGPAEPVCCGKPLSPLEPSKPDEAHDLSVEQVEDEWFVSSSHPMERGHHIMFAALVTSDRLELARAYAEWDFGVRFFRRGHGDLYWYCTRHGLFKKRI